MWLDAARELSEYWTHQQQVRDATGRPGLTDRAWLAPVLETFLRALPYTLRDTGADPGTQVQVTVTGAAPMPWVTTRQDKGWVLHRDDVEHPAATVEVDGDTLWRLCTRNITPKEARAHARVHGERRLADQVLQIVSIVR